MNSLSVGLIVVGIFVGFLCVMVAIVIERSKAKALDTKAKILADLEQAKVTFAHPDVEPSLKKCFERYQAAATDALKAVTPSVRRLYWPEMNMLVAGLAQELEGLRTQARIQVRNVHDARAEIPFLLATIPGHIADACSQAATGKAPVDAADHIRMAQKKAAEARELGVHSADPVRSHALLKAAFAHCAHVTAGDVESPEYEPVAAAGMDVTSLRMAGVH